MRPNGNTRTHPCGRSRSPQSVPNVFAGTLPTSSSEPVPERARCHVFSECSGPCCVPDRGRGWPRLLVSADSPTSDSLQPCGQPKQQFPGALESGPEVGAYCQRAFGQSDFGATSTEFPARRWSPLASTFSGPAFSLWPPIAVVGHR